LALVSGAERFLASSSGWAKSRTAVVLVMRFQVYTNPLASQRFNPVRKFRQVL
jgi:hypothetical protein